MGQYVNPGAAFVLGMNGFLRDKAKQEHAEKLMALKEQELQAAAQMAAQRAKDQEADRELKALDQIADTFVPGDIVPKEINDRFTKAGLRLPVKITAGAYQGMSGDDSSEPVQAPDQNIYLGTRQDRMQQMAAQQKAQAEQEQNQAMSEAAGLSDPRAIYQAVLARGGTTADAERIAKGVLDGGSELEPILQVDPRTGAVVKIGEMPKGGHIVQKPAPPGGSGSGSEPLVAVIDPATGKPVMMPRSRAAGMMPASAGVNGKPPTGIQQRNLSFFNRAKQADDTIQNIEPEIAKMGTTDQMKLQYLPNLLQSNAAQSYRQAQRAFTEARLRKDSGAAVPDHEYENDAKTYFAQPGDSPATLAQKAAARAAVLASLAYESGPALAGFYGEEDAPEMINTYRQRSKGSSAPAKPAAPATPGAPSSGMRIVRKQKVN